MKSGGLRREIADMLRGAFRPLTATEIAGCLSAGRNISAGILEIEGELADLRSLGHVVMEHDGGERTYRLWRRIPA